MDKSAKEALVSIGSGALTALVTFAIVLVGFSLLYHPKQLQLPDSGQQHSDAVVRTAYRIAHDCKWDEQSSLPKLGITDGRSSISALSFRDDEICRDWLTSALAVYPDCRLVITSSGVDTLECPERGVPQGFVANKQY